MANITFKRWNPSKLGFYEIMIGINFLLRCNFDLKIPSMYCTRLGFGFSLDTDAV